MALAHSPKTVTDGLVFYYDIANTKKSWIGAPTTNFYPNSTANYGIDNFTAVSSSELDPNGTFTARSWTITNTGAQAQFWYPYATTTAMNTYSVWLRASSNVTVWLYPQGTDEAEKTSVTVTTQWQRFSVSRTLSTSKQVGGLIRILSGAFSGTLYTWGHQLETYPFATTYVPTTGSPASRSNTQAILDLTGNNTITANSLTYNSNETFSFNGVDSYLSLGTDIQLSNNFTLNSWHQNPNTGYIIDQGNISTDPTGCLEWTNYGLSLGSNNISGVIDSAGVSSLNTNLWNNVTCSFSDGLCKFYINGSLSSTTTTSFTSFQPQGNILKIGRRAFNTSSIFSGTIGIVQIYNRVLTDTEVSQNFITLRGRYGR